MEARLEAPLVDPFTGEDLGINLLGIADLVLPSVDPSGPVIVDFKTSSRSSAPAEIVHEIQLGCYAYLLRSVTGLTEGSLQIRSLVKTKVPKVSTSQYGARTDAHLRRLFGVIREYLDCLDSGKFSYRPGWTCSMCDHKKRCSSWSAE